MTTTDQRDAAIGDTPDSGNGTPVVPARKRRRLNRAETAFLACACPAVLVAFFTQVLGVGTELALGYALIAVGFVLPAGWFCSRLADRLLPLRPGEQPSTGRRLLRLALARGLLLLLLVAVKLVWIAAVATDGADLIAGGERDRLMARRRYLIDRVTGPAFGPKTMPGMFSAAFEEEWAIGTLSMASSAFTNLAFLYPDTRQETVAVIARLIERMLEPDLRRYEIRYWGEDALDSLDGENGHIGYLGHLNLMLGAHRLLGGGPQFDDLHHRVTTALVRRLRNSRCGYLKTFPRRVFIPDNMVVYASVRHYDLAFGGDHSDTVERWLDYTSEHLLDPRTGLMVAWVSSDGRPLGPSRGSYCAWNSFYLPHISEEFAADQFARLEEHMAQTLPAGFTAIREYPSGVPGQGDIDSGPVVFGMSTSGTGFAVAGARRHGRAELVTGLLRSIEAVGSTVEFRGRRHYVVCPLVGEAIMLAMKTATPWDTRFLPADAQGESP